MSDGRVPIPSGLGGGSSAPLPTVDTTVLRDALAVVLLDYGKLAASMHRWVVGDALQDAPLAELEALGRDLASCHEALDYGVKAARDLYATMLAARRVGAGA